MSSVSPEIYKVRLGHSKRRSNTACRASMGWPMNLWVRKHTPNPKRQTHSASCVSQVTHSCQYRSKPVKPTCHPFYRTGQPLSTPINTHCTTQGAELSSSPTSSQPHSGFCGVSLHQWCTVHMPRRCPWLCRERSPLLTPFILVFSFQKMNIPDISKYMKRLHKLLAFQKYIHHK